MSAGLGIRIGTVTSVAALHPADTTVTRRSALDLTPGAAPSLAELWDRRSHHLVSGFADRVADPVELVDDEGRSHKAEDLFATATRALVAEASAGVSSDPVVVVAHPTHWTTYTTEVLADALERAGLPEVTLVPDSLAAMRWLEAHGPHPTTRNDTANSGLTVIYDLGATALDITLMRTGNDAGVLGTPVHSQEFGGAQFDHATMQYVLDTVSSSRSFDFDPFDPDTVGALVELRARCGEAKEKLSSDTATSLTIELPGIRSDVRLVRSELEDLIRTPLQATIALLADTVRSAGFDTGDVDQVLLVGGSSAIPLVAELISAELRVPVVAGPRPEETVALGAAILGSDIADATADDDAARLGAVGAVGAVGAGVSAAAPSKPVSRPAPTPVATASASQAGMSGRKKAGIVAGSVLALALLAGGGLGIGTALTSDNTAPEESGSQTAVADTVSGTEDPNATIAEIADSDGAAGPGGVQPTTITSADGTVTQIDPITGAPIAPAAGTPAAPSLPGDPTVAAPTVPAAQAPNIAPPNVQAPNVQPPTFQAPNVQPPSVNVPRLPAPDLGGTLGGVGQGLGDVVGGVGTGVGQGVGGLLGGVTGN